MTRRLLLVTCVATALSACQGLTLDKGNAYPCDFALGPGERDKACFPGDVCGVDNLCRQYVYEGPRFEGNPRLPVFGPGADAGQLVHPLVLDRPPLAVSADLPAGRGGAVYSYDGAGLRRVKDGHATELVVPLPAGPVVGFGPLQEAQPFFAQPYALTDGGWPVVEGAPELLLRDVAGRLALGSIGGLRAVGVSSSSGVAVVGARARVVPQPVSGALQLPGADVVAWTGAELGLVRRTGATQVEVERWLAGAGDVLDVAALTLRDRRWLVLLRPNGLWVLEQANAPLTQLAALEPTAGASQAGALRTDPDGRVLAATRRTALPGPLGREVEVLSTLQVNIGAQGPAVFPAWLDCAPCAADERVELLSPTAKSGAPVVELVCRGGLTARAVRVVGSIALTQTSACLSEPLPLPVPLGRVALQGSGAPLAWSPQSGLVVAGKAGELWTGESLTSLRPQFLDRVPVDVTPVVTEGGQSTLAAVTDDSLFILQGELWKLPGEVRNGFRRVPARELGVAEGVRLLGFVRGVDGWGVTDEGQLVSLRVSTAGAGLVGGPTLVSASGDPVRGALGGEAFTGADGGAVAFFLAADDSLYFVPQPAETLSLTAPLELTPDLTPEPSVPIRSLALERTALGTDGVSTARGYLVTSRSVYAWQLGGKPAHWSATPVRLSGGQPVEVWFDTRLSALGRVGYADGQVFTLPSGFQLTEPLPENAAGEGGQVLDYENLGGWPVAYASTGLFIAGWDVDETGKLLNRFPDGARNRPMTWRRVTLPDGSEPWLGQVRGRPEARPGRLFVQQEPRDVNGLVLSRLLVFLDDKVLQVATNQRK